MSPVRGYIHQSMSKVLPPHTPIEHTGHRKYVVDKVLKRCERQQNGHRNLQSAPDIFHIDSEYRKSTADDNDEGEEHVGDKVGGILMTNNSNKGFKPECC